jgi:non-ribosomal peptide synthetase component E (peptide arylation enzyme)
MTVSKRREAVRVGANMPPALKLWVEQQAAKDFTSLNSVIVRCVRLAKEASEQQRSVAG